MRGGRKKTIKVWGEKSTSIKCKEQAQISNLFIWHITIINDVCSSMTRLAAEERIELGEKCDKRLQKKGRAGRGKAGNEVKIRLVGGKGRSTVGRGGKVSTNEKNKGDKIRVERQT